MSAHKQKERPTHTSLAQGYNSKNPPFLAGGIHIGGMLERVHLVQLQRAHGLGLGGRHLETVRSCLLGGSGTDAVLATVALAEGHVGRVLVLG